MNRTLIIALLAGAATALPQSALARQPALAVKSVKAAASVPAGGGVAVQVRVARTRRSRATIQFYLSSDRTRGALLKGDARIRAGRARAASVAARPLVPAGQPVGTYRLNACIEDNCGATALRVTERPTGTRDLVAQAVAAGRLKPEQALVYRVFAAFGDKRLPAAFRGDGAAPDDGVMAEVLSSWPKLSAAQRAQVQPFFTPPAARGSWASPTAHTASQSAAPGCITDRLASREWFSTAPPGGQVRVWWLRKDEARVGRQARELAADADGVIWPKLKALLGREPLSDGRVRCFHGVDGKLDIYLMPVGDLGLGSARGMAIAYPPLCKAAPAFIVLDSRSLDRWGLAHELMHTFQYSYRRVAACQSYADLDEATATWAGQYVYPSDDYEHIWPWLLRQPDNSLAASSYDSWVFHLAMERLHGAGTIRAILDQTERVGALQAIDAAVPGHLEKAWPEFARVGWNQDPVSPAFHEWDRFAELPRTPGLHGGPIPTEQLNVGGDGNGRVDVPLNLEPLTRTYRHFKLGAGVRHVKISAPAQPGLSVQAIVRLHNGTTRTEDWTGRDTTLCIRTGDERPDEIVLVVANSSLTQATPAGSVLKLGVSNIGCTRYVGWVEGSLQAWPDGDMTWEESWRATDLVFEYVDWGNPPIRDFELTGGSMSWSTTARNSTTGCTWQAAGTGIPVTWGHLSLGVDVKPPWDNTYDVGVGFRGGISPYVPGTQTCPSPPRTYPVLRSPSGVLGTPSDPLDGSLPHIPADGTLEGTMTRDLSIGGTVTYTWHFEPDG